MNEFSLIYRYFAPLAGEGGLGLRDDAALLTPRPGKQLVITQDAMTAGVHFFADDPANLIARKLLRVNLSDLAAKGAKPLGYLLSLLMPAFDEAWLKGFSSGLAADQKEFGITLLGGDTSKINGPLTLSLTAIGTVETGKMWQRRGAQPGDTLYVTGTIGDAALGLKVRSGELPSNDFLLDRYLLPQPRLNLFCHHPVACQGQERRISSTDPAQSLRASQDHVTSCMDVSDGLVQDAGHLAAASGVKLVIEVDKVPLSEAAKKNSPLATHYSLLTGGDDYELLLTASTPLELPNLTPIGRVEGGEGVVVLDASGAEIAFTHKGWQHF